jgi:choline kinase
LQNYDNSNDNSQSKRGELSVRNSDTIAIILLAGIGRRMQHELPKSLIPFEINGEEVTFIERLLHVLGKAGVSHFILVVNSHNFAYFKHLESSYISLVVNQSDVSSTGSSLSLNYGLDKLRASVSKEMPHLLIMDGDIIFEQRLANFVVDFNAGSALFVTPNISEDEEEVRVYLQNQQPKLIGKGITSEISKNLYLAGESLGIIKLCPDDLPLLHSLTTWLCGSPSNPKAFGYARQKSEHEEIWQYFFNLERLIVVSVAKDLVFSECDSLEDREHINEVVLPKILVNDKRIFAHS